MEVGDKIKVKLITEMAGVASANILYYDVDDATLATTLEAAILEIATGFNAALGTNRSSAATLTCGTWENLDGNDPFTQAFFNIDGLGTAAALPARAAVRVARYGIDAGALKVGGIYVAGIDETAVFRQRLAGAGEMGTIEQFLVEPDALAAGPILQPGFFIDTVTPATPIWVETIKARTRARIVSLQTRQTKLCGA